MLARVGKRRNGAVICGADPVFRGEAERAGNTVHRGGRRLHDSRLRLTIVGQRADLPDGNIGELRLVHLNIGGAGGLLVQVGVIARGREYPIARIHAGFVGLDGVVLPAKGALDKLAVVPHAAVLAVVAEDAVAQRLAVGDIARSQTDGRQGAFGRRRDVDGQGDGGVVVGGDRDLDGADRALGIAGGGDRQLYLIGSAVQHRRGRIALVQADGRLGAGGITVGSGAFQRRQRRQRDGVLSGRAVDDGELHRRRIGHGGLLDRAARLGIAAVGKGVVLHASVQCHRTRDSSAAAGVRAVERGGGGVVQSVVQGVAALQAGERHTGDGGRCRAVIDLWRYRHAGDGQFFRRDGHADRFGSGILVAVDTDDLVVDTVCAGIGAGGNVRAVAARPGQGILHHAVFGINAARRHQLLRRACIGQAGDRRRGVDLVGGDAGLVNFQRLAAALHGVAVLDSGEPDGVAARLGKDVLADIVPAAADLLIRRVGEGDGRLAALLLDVEGHVRVFGVAIGAELDGGTAIHRRNILSIDLQVQILGRDGQALNGDVGQFRGVGKLLIRRGVPRILRQVIGIVRVHLVAGVSGRTYDILPRCALCQLQRADNGRFCRSGKLCARVGNDLLYDVCVVGSAEGDFIVSAGDGYGAAN